MYRFNKNLYKVLILGPKITHLTHFEYNMFFFYIYKIVTFMCSLSPSFMKVNKQRSSFPQNLLQGHSPNCLLEIVPELIKDFFKNSIFIFIEVGDGNDLTYRVK